MNRHNCVVWLCESSEDFPDGYAHLSVTEDQIRLVKWLEDVGYDIDIISNDNETKYKEI